MEERSLRSFDGTRIVYQVGGREGRWIVVANGYGGTFCAWDDLFAALEDRYRLLVWDYRGLHRSETPHDRSRLRIEDHTLDLEELLRAEKIGHHVLAGWSVGVQVALERYRRSPDGIDALLLIHGSDGRVLHRSLDGRLAGMILPGGLRALLPAVPALGRVVLPPLRLLARSEAVMRALALLGVVNASPPPPCFHESVERLLTLDYAVYVQMGLLADLHDAEDVLPTVKVPTLVTAGERDTLTPPRVMRRIASRVPGSVYFEVPGGTHYSLMEFPRLLANRIDTFLRGTLDHPAL
jgi:pimeloyl-ACP methyl ester carboxylesterase